jgi:hypothetical protein
MLGIHNIETSTVLFIGITYLCDYCYGSCHIFYNYNNGIIVDTENTFWLLNDYWIFVTFSATSNHMKSYMQVFFDIIIADGITIALN